MAMQVRRCPSSAGPHRPEAYRHRHPRDLLQHLLPHAISGLHAGAQVSQHSSQLGLQRHQAAAGGAEAGGRVRL